MAERIDLLRTQKNDVLKALETGGLAPDEFRWEWALMERVPGFVGAAEVPKLSHLTTGYHMTFDFREGELSDKRIYASPGTDSHETVFTVDDWRMAMRGVETWIKCVRREVEAPDLWAEVVSARESIETVIARVEPDAFSNDEKAVATDAIAEVREHVKKLAVSNGVGFRAVAEKLDHLEDAVERLGKRDWLYTAIGVLVTIVIGVAPDDARAVFSKLWASLRRALGGGA